MIDQQDLSEGKYLSEGIGIISVCVCADVTDMIATKAGMLESQTDSSQSSIQSLAELAVTQTLRQLITRLVLLEACRHVADMYSTTVACREVHLEVPERADWFQSMASQCVLVRSGTVRHVGASIFLL